jgi:hypothetical protein
LLQNEAAAGSFDQQDGVGDAAAEERGRARIAEIVSGVSGRKFEGQASVLLFELLYAIDN